MRWTTLTGIADGIEATASAGSRHTGRWTNCACTEQQPEMTSAQAISVQRFIRGALNTVKNWGLYEMSPA